MDYLALGIDMIKGVYCELEEHLNNNQRIK